MGSRAAEIRAGLKHPVIDGDGHWTEPIPIFLEYPLEAFVSARRQLSNPERPGNAVHISEERGHVDRCDDLRVGPTLCA